MNGLAEVPEDPRDGLRDATPTVGERNEQKSPVLTLTADQERLEALLGSAIAMEHARIAGPVDSRIAARYAAQVVDNSRLLSGGNPKLHLGLLRSHAKWMRGLMLGSSELRW